MGKLREDGGGFTSRCRGKRSNNYVMLMMLLAFVVLVALTTLLSMQTPLSLKRAYSDENNMYDLGSHFSNGESLQRGETEKIVVNPYTPVRPDGKSSSGWSWDWQAMLPGLIKEETFYCRRSHIRTDVCRLHGNVHLVGNSSFVLNSMEEKSPFGEEKIKPYTRKWEQPSMDKVREVTLIREAGSQLSWSCEVRHRVPAVVFSTGGYTGNVYHEFNDGLIPLYITSQHLKGEVVFVIVDYHGWWMVRYQEVIRQLSNYEVIDIANYTQSHCFSDVTVGLFVHEELGIDRSLMPKQVAIQHFRALIDRAYPVEESGWEEEFQTFKSIIPSTDSTTPAPQLVIIVREGSRVIMNLDHVVELATRMGFDVTLLKPDPTTEMKKIFWVLDRCDVLIGVHGAALTHFLFMRPGTVFIQVIPLGTDWAARTYYGNPAKKLGLHYLGYNISTEESSLSREYEKTDPVLMNPNAVVQQGWSVIKDIYLTKQNVHLSLARFNHTLEEANSKWKANPAKRKPSLLGSKSHRRRKRRAPSERFENSFVRPS